MAENSTNEIVYHPFRAGFCDDPFWDSSVTWHTDRPDLTECFQQTALIWVPCLFLWSMLPHQLYRSLQGRFKLQRWTWISVAKMTFSLILTTLAVAEVSYVAYQWNKIGRDTLPDVDVIAPLLKAATFLLSAVYVYLDRRNAEPSSAVLFFFWLLVALGSIATFGSKIEAARNDGISDSFRFGLLTVSFPLTCSQFILSCWADYFPERDLGDLSAVIASVYRKALRITSAAKRTSTVGEIVNLMSVDSQRLTDLMTYIHLLWSGPFQMALALYFLWQALGPSVLAGLGIMLLMVPINAIIGNRIRSMQLVTLERAAYLTAISAVIWILSPFLVSIASFATYVLVDERNILDAEKAFVSLSLFNILRLPLAMLPMVITSAVQANVSVNRLTKFLRNEELDPDNVSVHPSSDRAVTSAVSIVNGNFAWGKDEPLCLKDINIDVKEGQLMAVVGQVGSGKSSLVAAMLGLMERRSGNVSQKGSIAYVSQQAWIQNLTLKENILFGNPLDERRYQQVIDACALRTDLEILPAGDETEIGEKGINLSGGQKQRVSLARAVYSNSDVYFLDDPLSAVDAHVGKHLFDQVIGPNGLLKNKSRILVTHGIGFLPQTDKIIVLANNTVSETGSYQELIQNKGAFADFLHVYLTEESDVLEMEDPEAAAIKDEILGDIEAVRNGRTERSASIHSLGSQTSLRKVKRVSRQDSKLFSSRKTLGNEKIGGIKGDRSGNLVGLEKSEIGGVKWDVYRIFLHHISFPAALAILLFYFISNGVSISANIWLGHWVEDHKYPVRRNSTEWRDYRLGIYGGLGAIQGLFVFFSALLMAYGQIRASRNLHQNMLARILRAPMAFFDTTPLGRIVNRFSKDVDTVDAGLPECIRMFLNCLFMVLSVIVVICMSTPIFGVVIPPLGILYYVIQRFFIVTSRQLKRLESVSRSPIYSHFQESVTGTSVIVATRQTDRFIRENELRVDNNNASYYPNIVSQRWLSVRLETVGNCITFFAALFAVIGREKGWDMHPKDIGLSISYAMSITTTLNWMVRQTSELESNLVSVERIKEYTEVEQEADWINPNRRPEKNWPERGQIKFENYQTRYRPDLGLVLKGITANIGSGEKVGIVGRTGAGKSSLTLALFRIIEAADGSINIDGINIASYGLHDVRSRITIIPQEPVLFSGALRLNLDPFKVYTDEEVWRALENSHLKRFVSSLPDGLEHSIAEGGENLSVGQRQLICLARALLRKTKILVLDEATAAIDLETDDLIQRTIREKFVDCTILTIAHRLNTIMDTSRIMVLDQGKIKEFDSPSNLLQDQSTIFYGLAKDAGIAS
ncbi:Multidrug resistance-associated protein 1 [Hypsibius exemplaris]|uniref:ABC-type glutathione-S-conjugate transporter n=1 Tax=Hypsibius exemplaris TaxID=2072580 RepID=A0A1W0WQC8_HYPEX|nr:Multidrug resistance-associated protein 1 [Hypsibius exemplaris]